MTSKGVRQLARRGHLLTQSYGLGNGPSPNKICGPAKYNSRLTSSATTVSKDKKTYSTIPQFQPDWEKAVSDAEKVFEYPTSFFTIQSLLSDGMVNITGHLKKLVGSSHPLIKTAKRIIYDEQNMQMRGLVVLLMSKAAGHVDPEELALQERITGVSQRQRTLAEVTEMLNLASVLHKGVVNVSGDACVRSDFEDMECGNKIAILAGDFLLANSMVKLSTLNCFRVVELISNTVADFTQADFVCTQNIRGTPLPTSGICVHDWEEKNFLASASLLASSCQSAAILSGHDENLQRKAFDFGKELALAWQAYADLEPFMDLYHYLPGMPFDLTSSPVVFHLGEDPDLFQEIHKAGDTLDDVDYKKIHDIIMAGKGVAKAKELCQRHSESALRVLHSGFELSDARTALGNIISALRTD